MFRKISFILFFILSTITASAQYISEVLEFKPAPGQFINASPWGVPCSANSLIGGITGSMSLGAFGGYVVFKFENPVENHPDNPYGIDFVIYGNPLKNFTNPEIENNVIWSEPGIVSVMKDENGNGLPDDTWYELAGSDYFFSSTIKNYSVTYFNPKQATAADVPWTDNQGNSGAVLANNFHLQPYYPRNDSFPDVNQTDYTLTGTRIDDHVDTSNPTFVVSAGRPWGYVDNNLRNVYNGLPDNPYTDNVQEGSGGDAFDIHWAVDSNGNYVDLDRVDFIKVHNAVLADAGWLGEASTEITGAFDVAPNSTVDGELSFLHFKELPDTVYSNMFPVELFVYNKGRLQKEHSIDWSFSRNSVSIDKEKVLFLEKSGELTINAALTDKPVIAASVTTYIKSLDIKTKIQDVLTIETAADTAIDLSGLFVDPDDEPADIIITIVSDYNNSIISADVTGNLLALSFLKPGVTTLKLKGEANGKMAIFPITVTVVADQLPVIANPIKDVVATKNDADLVISLINVFTDPDNNDAAITKSVKRNSNDALVSASISGNELILSFAAEAIGEADIVIEALSNGKTVTDTFKVTVVTDQLPVVANEIADILVTKNTSSRVISLANVFTDADNDDAAITKSVKRNSNDALVSASISGNELILSFAAEAIGEADIVIEALSNGKTVTDTFKVTVVADQLPVVANAIEDINVAENATDLMISLANIFTDPDNDDTAITKSVKDNSNDLLVSTNISGDELTLSFTANLNGEAIIVIEGLSNGKTVTDTFTVTVIADQVPVVANLIDDVTVVENATDLVISLANVFTDPDNEDAAITKSVKNNSNEELVSASIVGDKLSLSFAINAFGEARIIIEGKSNGKSVFTSFNVTVNMITGIEDTPVGISTIDLYPNPASEFISIQKIDDAIVTVYNLTGLAVMEEMLDSERTKLNISQLKSGIYMVRIFTRRQNHVIRLIKE